MPNALTRLRLALACGLLSFVVALSYVHGDRAALIVVFLILVTSYATMAVRASKAPRSVAFFSVAFAFSGLFNWHGVAGVLVSLLSSAEMALSLSVLVWPDSKNATPAAQ